MRCGENTAITAHSCPYKESLRANGLSADATRILPHSQLASFHYSLSGKYTNSGGTWYMHVSHAAIASTMHSETMMSEERKRVLCITWSMTEQARLLGLAIFRIVIRLFPRMARSKSKNVAHPKHPVRWQRSDPGISMDTSALCGGIGNFHVSKLQCASERVACKYDSLVGKAICLWWYQRLSSVENSSTPVR